MFIKLFFIFFLLLVTPPAIANDINQLVDVVVGGGSKCNVFNENILSSVVEIKTFKINDEKINLLKDNVLKYEKSMVSDSVGSGFFISNDGYILTNNHVIDGADKILVVFNNKEYKAELIGNDFYTDLAVLKINVTSNNFFDLKENIDYNIGDEIVAIGNPYGFGLSVSRGIISAKNRIIKNMEFFDLIQTDAHISKGNSGGPLLNCNGDVIGINTVLYRRDYDTNGVAFAIPINSNTITVINRLKESGYIQRGWIGIRGITIDNDIFSILNSKRTNGVFVLDVDKDSSADRAGIRPSDIVVSYDGKSISTTEQLTKMIRESTVGSRVEVIVLRNNKYLKIKVKIQDSPENNKYTENNTDEIFIEFLGASLLEINDYTINKYKLYSGLNGLYVVNVRNDSFAEYYGLEAGDIILFINQTKLTSKKDLEKVITEIKNKEEFLLMVRKNNGNNNVVLKLKSNIIN